MKTLITNCKRWLIIKVAHNAIIRHTLALTLLNKRNKVAHITMIRHINTAFNGLAWGVFATQKALKVVQINFL